MNVWLLKISESWPWIESGKTGRSSGDQSLAGRRPLRNGMLAEALAARGHKVTWFNSVFDHVTKENIDLDLINDEMRCSEYITIQGLRACTYRRSRSFRRLLHHWQTAKHFKTLASQRQAPDLIYSSWPTVELCWEGLRFARSRGIPLVIDVLDLWPEAITDVVPNLFRPLVRAVLYPYYALAKRTLRESAAVISITDDMLQWALDFADRKAARVDRVFPLGYMATPAANTNSACSEYWNSQGVWGGQEQFVACYAGLFPTRTDLLTVVAAARILFEKGESSIKFVLCGTGDLEGKLRAKAAGLDNVVLPGWVEHPVLKALMARCSVALFPYPRDVTWIRNLPNKFFEYLAEGLPIVSCLEGEAQRQIENNACGVMYRAHDPNDLVRVLCAIRDDPTWRKSMVANALGLSPTFDAGVIYDHLVSHLERIAAPPPGRGTVALAD